MAKLQQLPGKDGGIYGSANLVQGFTQLGLIDEYQLLVHPLVLGSGKRLWGELEHLVNLKLLRTEAFKNGASCCIVNQNESEDPAGCNCSC